MIGNKSITIDFPHKLIKFELKEYLEYNFKVYIKKESTDIVVFGNPTELSLCQEHADYFKSVDSQFLLSLNAFSKEALSIPNLRLLFQSRCKVLISIDDDILYIFGQLFNTTQVHNFLCHYNNIIEKDNNFPFPEYEETDLNIICRALNIKLPDGLLRNTKIFIHSILKHRDNLFNEFEEPKITEFYDLPLKLENLNIANQTINEKPKIDEPEKFLNIIENDATCLLQNNQDKPVKYRTIIVDGSNVAFEHGIDKFSYMGIKIAVDYFISRGHTKVYALLPRHRQPLGGEVFQQMELGDHLKYTPSRIINKVRETPYDDRFILDAAIATDGIVVSNDQYRDLMLIDKYKNVIYNRLLPYTFIENHFIIPNDPRGQNGPSLDDMLLYPDTNVKKSPRKSQIPPKKTRSMQTHSKAGNSQNAHQHKSHRMDLKVYQQLLYRDALAIFPSCGPSIRSILIGNPEVTDLNTIINFVMMANNK